MEYIGAHPKLTQKHSWGLLGPQSIALRGTAKKSSIFASGLEEKNRHVVKDPY